MCHSGSFINQQAYWACSQRANGSVTLPVLIFWSAALSLIWYQPNHILLGLSLFLLRDADGDWVNVDAIRSRAAVEKEAKQCKGWKTEGDQNETDVLNFLNMFVVAYRTSSAVAPLSPNLQQGQDVCHEQTSLTIEQERWINTSCQWPCWLCLGRSPELIFTDS